MHEFVRVVTESIILNKIKIYTIVLNIVRLKTFL